ncbi:MAG: mevalonate kinase [Myxococcales bacterium]|nr:mevalonate kinase [Myxococcales bacterium]MCB9707431.1 mevalonate kinase [Myxococcales bacterium]
MGYGFGKIILLGEHAVVYGHPAIAAALDSHRAEATACRSTDSVLTIEPWGKTVTAGALGPPGDTAIREAFESLLRSYDNNTSPVFVSVNVNVPAGAGLGCSAAIGVAIVRALDELFHIDRAPADVAALSLGWEKVFHGNPSGVDSAVAAHGGLVRFAKGHSLALLHIARPLHIVIALSNVGARTKEMVAFVAKQLSRDERRVVSVFGGIGSLVNKAQGAVEQGDLETLGHCMDLNHALLSSLLLSTPELELMCAEARLAGALGAKLTGSGGGGAILALASSSSCAQSIEERLASLSRQCFTVVVHASSHRKSPC